MKKRLAFTLVELLTVIAIIGILVGLLLPAVQMVRESARRAACQNNIRQLGLALENYHAVHNRYPHGWNAEGGPGHSGWSWLAYSLPFLEQTPIYEQIDFSTRLTDSRFENLLGHRMEFLFCPSAKDIDIDTFAIKGILPTDLPPEEQFEFPFTLGRTQYVGCVGTLFTPTQILNGL